MSPQPSRRNSARPPLLKTFGATLDSGQGASMYQLSRRILMIASATVALVAVPAFAAEAKVLKVTGKQTTVTPSSSLTSFLASRNIKVAAVAPATLSGGTVTFPITGGAVKSPSLNGRLILGGRLQFNRKTH